ncbi:MAG: FAD-dependent oxidoreductase [Clostridia bacterium]|nr:FAD-dependent oxidoreductase [Clostridia bacterium]
MPQCDLLVIGSGPAAWSCAITARQRSLNVLVAGAEAGTWLSRAERIDNYPGMPEVSGAELLRIFRSQAESLGAQFMHGVARQVQPMGDEFMTLIGNEIVTSRAVALCMGAAKPRMLPGEEELLGAGVSWCGTCDGMFYRGKEVAVVSAWTGGVEEAEFLARLAAKVDYYSLAPHALPEERPYTVIDAKPASLRRENGRILLTHSLGETAYDGVFVFRPAVAPETLLPGLEAEGAFIRVDRGMRTNIPRVYAAGDCTGHPLQIAKAVGEGNIAAISAAEDLAKEA